MNEKTENIIIKNYNAKMKVLKKNCQRTKPIKPEDIKKNDITVFKIIETQTIEKDGTITIKKVSKPVNITRAINETSKILKNESAIEKLKKIQNAING